MLLLLLLLMRRRAGLLLLLLQLHLNLQLLILLVLLILIDMQREFRAFLRQWLITRFSSRIIQAREFGSVKVLRSGVVSEKGDRYIIL